VSSNCNVEWYRIISYIRVEYTDFRLYTLQFCHDSESALGAGEFKRTIYVTIIREFETFFFKIRKNLFSHFGAMGPLDCSVAVLSLITCD